MGHPEALEDGQRQNKNPVGLLAAPNMNSYLKRIVTIVAVACWFSQPGPVCADSKPRSLPMGTRGLYLPAGQVNARTLPQTLKMAEQAGVNTLVVDVKDS